MESSAMDRETRIQEACRKMYTGYFIIAESLMGAEGFTDFLFDNFHMVMNITTVDDENSNQVRLLMRSVLFNQGFGQYTMDIERGKDDHRTITTIKFVK